MAIKDIILENTSIIEEATDLLSDLSDREGQYIWKKFTAENGELLGYVTADEENAYPDCDILDGYWYEKVNFIEFTSGTTDITEGSALATNTFYFVTA